MPLSPGGLWSLSQRRGLTLLLSTLILILGIRLLQNPLNIDQPGSPTSKHADQLADRIDPNTAQAPELAAIPTLGEKRAEAMVEYRARYVAAHPGKLAFTQPRDLEHVSGIGLAMVETMEPFLIFPAQISTRP